MDPDKIAEGTDESSQQIALITWARSPAGLGPYPELKWLYHIPNGGSRGDTKRSAQIAGNRLKAEGVKKGVLDLALMVPRTTDRLDRAVWAELVTPLNGIVLGLFIEMKRPGNIDDTSAEQDEFIAYHREIGYACVVCDTYYMARFYLEQYLGVKQ